MPECIVKEQEKTDCPVCSSNKTFKIVSWEKGYSIYKCGCCRMVYSFPLPSDKILDDFYLDFLYNKPHKNKIQRVLKKKKLELVNLFSHNLSDNSGYKKFIDFGGGCGIAVKAAGELGWDSYYFDISEKSLSFVESELDISKNHTFSRFSEIEGKKFDFILADNVIEHDRSPVEFVRKLYNLLEPEGTLIIKTPHAGNSETIFYPLINWRAYLLKALKYNSLKSVIYGWIHRFWHCDPPRHIYSFSQDSLKKVLDILEIRNYQIGYYWTPFLEYSIMGVLFQKPSGLKGILKRIVILPLCVPELVLQSLKVFLKNFNMISPGGLILKINKLS